jgi:hypothetical protein
MVFFERYPQKEEIPDNAFEMFPALGTEMVDASRSSLGNTLALLTVEEAQGIPHQPRFAIGAQLRDMLGIISFELLKIMGTA